MVANAAATTAQIVSLWQEASALLAADPLYTAKERTALKAFYYQQLAEAARGKASAGALDAKHLGVPLEFAVLAHDYGAQMNAGTGHVIVETKNAKGKPRPNLYFRLINLDAPDSGKDGRTNLEGELNFKVPPGKYMLEGLVGRESPERRIFVVDPKETKRFTLKFEELM